MIDRTDERSKGSEQACLDNALQGGGRRKSLKEICGTYGEDLYVIPPVSANCTLATSIHPVSPRLRKYKIQRNKQIHIGRNVWLGAGAIILPGVTVGYLSLGRHTDTLSGGEVVFQGTPQEIVHCEHSKTGRYLRNFHRKRTTEYAN